MDSAWYVPRPPQVRIAYSIGTGYYPVPILKAVSACWERKELTCKTNLNLAAACMGNRLTGQWQTGPAHRGRQRCSGPGSPAETKHPQHWEKGHICYHDNSYHGFSQPAESDYFRHPLDQERPKALLHVLNIPAVLSQCSHNP